MEQSNHSQTGIANLVILGIMAFLALSIPTATKLVQQTQENRGKAAEENYPFTCDILRETGKYYFEVCKDYDNICFNKINGEHQGCSSINENNGGDCTDPNHNVNATRNILCSIKSNTSLSCDTLYEKKQKYFATCAEGKYTGACFNKQTGEFRGCNKGNENNCQDTTLNINDQNKIFCSVKENDSDLWTDEAGLCGSAHGKTFEATPTNNLCQKGNVSRNYFDSSNHRYVWRCGNVEKLGNQTALCYAFVNGIPGSSKISLDKKEISLGVGQSIKINVTLTPPDPTEKITWTSDMPDFFSVDSNGVIKSLKGSASGDITAMTSKGQGASVRVNTSIYNEKIDAKCGSANGKTFTSIPDNYLCQQSSVSYGQLKGNKYHWTCIGENGGSSAECEATITNGVNQTSTPSPIPTSSAYLYFNPQNQNQKIGDTFQVTAGVNSLSNIIGGVDVVGTFDSSKLELISINKSSSMVFNKGDCSILKKDNITGNFSLSCFVDNSSQVMAVKGNLVNLTFKAKLVGSAKIQFVCKQNSLNDSNIVNLSDVKDLIACDRNINANIVITSGSATVNGACGDIKYSQLTQNSPNDKKITLCKSGKVTDYKSGQSFYTWTCTGVNGGKSSKCAVSRWITPPTPNPINGACNTPKFEQLTKTTDKNSPKLLCKSGKVSGYKGLTRNAGPFHATINPISSYSWTCLGTKEGSSAKCKATPTPSPVFIPATAIDGYKKEDFQNLKIGESKIFNCVLTPRNTTDNVKWSTSGSGEIEIKKYSSPKGIPAAPPPGMKLIQITGKKAGSVTIKLTTDSGKSMILETKVSNQKIPTPSPIPTKRISLFHNFAPKYYGTDRKIGKILTNDIVIQTGGKKIDSATIVYCYTDLLKPNLNSVKSNQLAKVISNKNIGNNCAQLQVTFNNKLMSDSMYKQYYDYVLSYQAEIIKYGKGTLKIDCNKSSLFGIDGKKIQINDPNCGYNNGTQFTLTDPQEISPTPTKTVSKIDGKCGSANGKRSRTKPNATNLCSRGKATQILTIKSTWKWVCQGINGENANCSAPKIIDGKCGAKTNTCSYGVLYSAAPDTAAKYIWLCKGINGGKTVKCSSIKPTSRYKYSTQ